MLIGLLEDVDRDKSCGGNFEVRRLYVVVSLVLYESQYKLKTAPLVSAGSRGLPVWSI